MKRPLLIAALLLLLISIPAPVSAAMMPINYTNQFDSDEIILQIGDVTSGADLSISTVLAPSSWNGASGWQWSIVTPTSISYNYFDGDGDPSNDGFAVAGTAGFRFYLLDAGLFDFLGAWDNFDFTLTWDERLDGAQQGSGAITYVNGVPTPLPASAWMLISGLGLFIGVKRRRAT